MDEGAGTVSDEATLSIAAMGTGSTIDLRIELRCRRS